MFSTAARYQPQQITTSQEFCLSHLHLNPINDFRMAPACPSASSGIIHALSQDDQATPILHSLNLPAQSHLEAFTPAAPSAWKVLCPWSFTWLAPSCHSNHSLNVIQNDLPEHPIRNSHSVTCLLVSNHCFISLHFPYATWYLSGLFICSCSVSLPPSLPHSQSSLILPFCLLPSTSSHPHWEGSTTRVETMPDLVSPASRSIPRM